MVLRVNLAQRQLGEIGDDDLKRLVLELGEACNFPPTRYQSISLRQFIHTCREATDNDGFTPRAFRTIKPPWPGGVLAAHVGKLEGTAIWELIEELAAPRGLSAECFMKTSVAAALNKLTAKQKKRRY